MIRPTAVGREQKHTKRKNETTTVTVIKGGERLLRLLTHVFFSLRITVVTVFRPFS